MLGGGRRMSNRVGARQSAHINQGVNEKTAGRMMRRRWGDDEECGAPVAIWLRVCGMLRNIRGGCVTEAGWFPSPRSPRSPRVCGPTGLGWTPFTTQSEGRAAEFPLPPPPPPLSPHSHSLHPSLLRGNNREHVSSDTCTYSVPTDTHRLSGRLELHWRPKPPAAIIFLT